MPDQTPDPVLEREPESLPEPGPRPEDDYSPQGDWDPRIQERPPPEDFGIPHIDIDRSGRFKVPKLKADYCLLEQAQSDVFLELGLDRTQPIAWLWPERIPIGKLTLIEGESNSGTSFLVADMAARVSSGKPWPGDIPISQPVDAQPVDSQPVDSQPADSRQAGVQSTSPYPIIIDQPSHVIVVNGGDNLHDTLAPRLISMGANMQDFTFLSGITTRDPAEMRAGKAETRRRISLPADLGHIEYQLRKRSDTQLVIVDSLSDFCLTDKQFRETLTGLHEIAERCHVAVVATARPRNWHSARSKLKPSADRRGESVRCVLNVLVDPHDPSLRYLAPARMNFCREPNWLPFRIGDGKVDWGEPLAAAPVYSRLSAAAQEQGTLLQDAIVCLRDTLAVGDMPAKTALRQVMECGFSKATVVRARRELGVRSVREGWGPHGWWNWSIKPKPEPQPPREAGENGEPGENGTHESAADGTHPESSLEPADEFGGVNFDRIFRAAVIRTLNQNRAVEIAAMGEELAGGALSNGKPSKNGRRPKPR
jgi:putative DNA primase/helicase